MNMPFLPMLTGTTDPIQILVAAIIIVVSLVTLFFLFRNVSMEFRKVREEQLALREKRGTNQDEAPTIDHLITDSLSDGLGTNELKGLINQEIHRAKEGTISALMLLNLDNFGSLKDKHGADKANKVIKEVAARLKKTGEKKHISGSLDSDIFLYFMSNAVDTSTIKTLADQILAAVAEPLKSIDESITTSIGIVLFPFDGITVSALIKNAEVALYVAKKQGKNQYALYSSELIATEQFNVSYYQEIKKSIKNDEFLLYYQPILDIKTGKIIGMESLLRWKHPTMGILPPGKFLNVMDLTGDITWFGAWGFEKIVKQYAAWKKQLRLRDVFISTNLSPKQLVMENLARTFFDIVRKNDFDAESFCLEIIDYYTVIKSPIAVDNLREFRRYGFRLAIDDLGDRFELQEDLDRIPANIIKISREDVLKIQNGFEESASITRIIGMAIQKQKVVIAEGIETPEMITMMANSQVRFMQGYYFSQPISTEAMTALLKNPPWKMDTFDRYLP